MRRILVVRTGTPTPQARARFGEFTDWFERLLAPEVVVVDAVRGEPFPARDRIAGVVVTGSRDSVTARKPWMERTGAWLVEVSSRVPVLGVCFGHQLLARALGATVERNPKGPEVGTREIALTEEGRRDPLFSGLPAALLVQENHEDHVPDPPAGATVLAGNDHTPVQSFAHGGIRTVQFHPEFDAARNRLVCTECRADLDAARPGLGDEAVASIRETPLAERVLANWVRAYVGG